MEQAAEQSWWKQWGKVVLLVGAILLLAIMMYFAKRTYSYYEQIRTGTVDFSQFEHGATTNLTNAEEVKNPNLAYVNNFVDDPSIGPADAKLTIVAFEDFQCPNCGEVFLAEKQMLSQYGSQIRFVYRDFPITDLHEHAQAAAEAGQCANDQRKFWPYHDMLFQHQEQLDVTYLKQYAQQLGLNTDQFDNCLDSGKYTEEVKADFADGLRAGVGGTPTFFFNGNKLAGVITYAGFQKIINYFQNN
ncbi:MAG: thioredoxin domain-containing protein [Candidatus Kerfeldbacteria bacterium]|nr:thioredoxin domain-containing protein [Candidatus Kerfeldbacteria bacterium]